jgi:hypothetical protein
MKHFFAALVLAAIAAAGSAAHASTPVLPLKASENGRFLVDQKGEPFFVVGDAAWSLIAQLSEDDAERYLADRQARGFNAIIINLAEHHFCNHPPKSLAGLAPFNTPGDLSTPNDAYFEFARKMIEKAQQHGIVVLLAPCYLGFDGGDEGWFQEMKAGGPEKLVGYGKYVGRRFNDLPNIVWLTAGDFVPKPEDQWTVNRLAEGLQAADPVHLITAQGSRGFSAIVAFGDQKWMTVNTVYTSEKSLLEEMWAEYNRTPVRPFFLIESIYEAEHNSKPQQIRRQAYWTILGGGCGQFFGNNPIWHFDAPGLFPAKNTWQEALSGTGTQDMTRLRDLFAGLAWQQLVPDQKHAVVTDSYGKGTTAVATAQTADRKLSVSYIPSTGDESREVTVDLSHFAGPVTARWYNPAKGDWTAITSTPLPNRDSHTFQTPGDNGTGASDWLLILESR